MSFHLILQCFVTYILYCNAVLLEMYGRIELYMIITCHTIYIARLDSVFHQLIGEATKKGNPTTTTTTNNEFAFASEVKAVSEDWRKRLPKVESGKVT